MTVERYRMNEGILVQILIFPHLKYFQEVENHNHRLEYERFVVEDLVLKILESTKQSCLKLSRNHRRGLLGQ